MRTFVVAQNVLAPAFPVSTGALGDLIAKLEQVQSDQEKGNQVIAVTDTYGLSPNARDEASDQQLKAYRLDDFRSESPHQINPDHNLVVVDGNVLAAKIQADSSPWLIINLEHHSVAGFVDFVKKLSRFVFLSNGLANKTLVLLVPAMHVGHYSRLVNEGFNNLPVSPIEIDRSGQLSVMFMSTTMEKIFLSFPAVTLPTRRLYQLFMHAFQRLVRQG